jgi:hypothetical protein
MNATVTLDTIRDALRRIERNQHTAADAVIIREWFARQEATIALQAQRIAELQAHSYVLSDLLDEEA